MSTVYEELARRLRRTDLLLLRAVRRQRARPAMRAKGQFWGSVITDDEVDALLRAHGEIDYPATNDGLDGAIRSSEALRDAPGGRFPRLREAFTLGGDDADLVLLALAPEISAGYAKIFAYLNDNLNQGFLTVDLATRVLRTERRARLALQARLMHGSPLVKNRLLLLNPPDGAETHTARRVHPSGRLLRWLLEEEELPSAAGFTPLDISYDPFIPGSARERLAELGAGLDRPHTYTIVGATEGSREGVAMAIARRCKRPLVRVDLERCTEYLEQPWDLVRELRLARAIPYLINVVEAQDDPSQRTKLINLGTAVATLDAPVLVGAADRRSLTTLLGSDRPSVTILTGKSTFEERQDAWGVALGKRGWDEEQAPEIAERFYSIGGTTIERVLNRAEAESGGREPDVETLWAAAREGSRPEFRGLAQHVVPRYVWDDLILPDKIMSQLHHLVNYLEHQETVFHRWGARKVRARGYGIKALFSGGPGTGKTMAAEVIAGSLGLDLFRVDLSQVISRWVGETEKNLKEIFDAAEGGTAVILFDEADALFGSRGDVKQAQDRFANQEVSFLLQRLEVFEGCAILTTNLQENIDEAFLRRFGAVVEFPMPSASERRQLWDRAIPTAAPVGPDLDRDYLANQFHLAGGSIINSAINACILAATDHAEVGMRHAIRAIGQELVKMGKQVNRVHFGEYYDLVSDL
ncbi:MAG: ATP-binding protein [Alphaproteobacteria bacterium]|nr:ATP-binding protein [Alphaproteobacteria bacterium]